MKRVAIITINSKNYGNRLQNYALQQVIQSLGYEAETIERVKELGRGGGLLGQIKETLRRLTISRTGLFQKFDREFLCMSKFHAAPNEVERGLKERYDIFVAGSDQIWNPHYGHVVGKSDLLLFAQGKRRVSYAASIWVDFIPAEQQEEYRSAWSALDAISVREQAGAKLVKELAGREAEVVLDPTLLFGAEQWEKVERKPPQVPNRPYVLVYILGTTTDQLEREKQRLQQEKSLQVMDIMKKNPDGKLPAIGPSEFLYCIHHAECVLTNSFHALVFSFLFHRPVTVFPRAGIDMSSRIVTFANMARLEQKLTPDGGFSLKQEVEFAQADAWIEAERDKSIQFLTNALNGSWH